MGSCGPQRRARTLFHRPGEVAEGIRQRNNHPDCFEIIFLPVKGLVNGREQSKGGFRETSRSADTVVPQVSTAPVDKRDYCSLL